jgi:hypothetical protein
MFNYVILVSLFPILMWQSSEQKFFPQTDLKSEVQKFCLGKSSVNFCSPKQLMISYEIIQQKEKSLANERKQKENERKIKQIYKILNNYKSVNFLRDLIVDRYF